jgi:hypothetical protein
VTEATTGPHAGARPSKAWIALLVLGVVAILILLTCIAGVVRDVDSRTKTGRPPTVTPTPSRTTPGPSIPVSPALGGSAAAAMYRSRGT